MFSERVVNICRHRDLEWFDAVRCVCRQCGRRGEWLDGFMLWQRRPDPSLVASVSVPEVAAASEDVPLASGALLSGTDDFSVSFELETV